jgi:hypothetical protein
MHRCELIGSRISAHASSSSTLRVKSRVFLAPGVREGQSHKAAGRQGIFKHEPTSNVDYNQEMEMEIEGLDGDDMETIQMMALHGSNAPADIWSLPIG